MTGLNKQRLTMHADFKQAEGYIKSWESIIVEYNHQEAYNTMMMSGLRYFGEDFKLLVDNHFMTKTNKLNYII